MTVLYKKESKGKIRVWEIWTDGATLSERSGILGGKLVQHNKVCEPKHVGKSNETTPAQQAINEMQGKIKVKLDTGYFETQEEAQNEEVILPMLAKSFDNEAKKVDWTQALAQPKLDGMRCLTIFKGPGDVSMISRKGQEITTLPHLMEEFKRISERQDFQFPFILDGELYAHGKTFQENMKLIKKYRPNETEEIIYHTYDTISDKRFSDRYQDLLRFMQVQAPLHTLIVDTVPVTSREELSNLHAEYLSAEYEGTMVRWGDEGYKIDGRSSHLLKYKDFKDLACRVVDIVPMESYPLQGLVVCEIDDAQFKATPKMSHEERENLLANRDEHIGKVAEIRFFEYTDGGLPRFPVFTGFRLDK